MRPFICLMFFLASFSSLSCNQSPGAKDYKNEQTAEVYTCPMHPEVESDKPGTCPKCGMDLVKKDEPNHADSSSNKNNKMK